MPKARRAALARPAPDARDDVVRQAREIVEAVRADGDAALRALHAALRWRRSSTTCAVSAGGIRAPRAASLSAEADRGARARHRERARVSTRRSCRSRCRIETMPGVRCERIIAARSTAVGLYVPAGSAPLPSAVIMLAVPARIAGCPRACSCTPPARDGKRNAAVLVAARAVRHRHGVQGRRRAGHRRPRLSARRACRKVDKIFGPGSALGHGRQAARRRRSGRRGLRSAGRASEVLVIADDARERRASSPPTCSRRPSTTRRRRRFSSRRRARWRSAVAASRSADARRCRAATILEKSAGHAAAASSCAISPRPSHVANDYAAEHLILQVREPRALACRRSRTPARSSSAHGRRSPWATTAPAPTTCCRPTATRARTAACRCSTSEADHGAGAHADGPARARPHGRDARRARRPRRARATR